MEEKASSKNAISESEGKERQQLKGDDDDLAAWSTRVEDLVDNGDEEGAVQLLEKVVESLQIRDDASTNLGLASALNDLGRIYASQGYSLKSDGVFNSALLIKQRRAQKVVDEGNSWEDNADNLSSSELQHSKKSALSGPTPDAAHNEIHWLQLAGGSSAEPSAESAKEAEEDWESVLETLPLPLKPSSPTHVEKPRPTVKSASKQRGRGSFTYGEMGMYSDNLEVTNADDNSPRVGSDQSDHIPVVDGGASHVLVLRFSPNITTRDLEDLVKPFSRKESCSIRWIDDTRALAIFSSPAMAREALVGIKDDRFKVSVHSETSEIDDRELSMRDLAPPGPRPASSARVAQRMIAGALSRQGVSKALLAKSQGSVKDIQTQERLRKERLQSRVQLRDEAWGSDDE